MGIKGLVGKIAPNRARLATGVPEIPVADHRPFYNTPGYSHRSETGSFMSIIKTQATNPKPDPCAAPAAWNCADSLNGLSVLAALLLLLLAGCTSVPPSHTLQARPMAVNATTNIDNPHSTVQALRAQHSEWAGTPYRLGGMSKAGVDCSGFVWNTFAHRFGLDLPRTTDGQKQVGQVVARDRLAPGDLVFFQTGYGKLHSGIYLERGLFLHASSSRGVMLSKLSNPYWRENYWHARRVR